MSASDFMSTNERSSLADPHPRCMSSLDISRVRLHAQGIEDPLPYPETVVSHLGAVQAQDYHGALWSIALRMAIGATRADVERAITDRTIIRSWPMRGTLHFIPAIDARWMLELLTPRIMKGAAGRHRQLELDAATFRRSRTLIAKALARNAILTLAALETGGVSTAGQRGIHILQRLCMECMLCYGPHSAKQPTFVLFDGWVNTSRRLAREDALRTMAERFFVSHGPASMRDFVAWTGMFLSTLVLDGQVCGTWRRAARAKSVAIEASPFVRLKAAERRAFAIPVQRYAQFLGVPVAIAWVG